MRVPRAAIVLFDIDGTLIRTDRAGSRAMNRAFGDLFGIEDAFDGIQMAGRTDRWILADAAARAGVDMTGGAYDRFRDRYVACLLEALPARGGMQPAQEHAEGRRVLPGVRTLLDAIASGSDMFPALLTGNCEEGARVKLEYFDLWRFFRCGAFGDEVTDRNHLVDVALQRAEACGVRALRPSDVIIVGDTVLDVACAKAAGARCVAVATGPFDADTLSRAGADLVMHDLSDTGAFLRFATVQI